MLDISPAIVCRLIELAHEFHAQEQVSFPETPFTEIPATLIGHDAGQMLADHANDLSLQEFTSIVNDLEPGQQQQLVALMWLGRGSFTLDEWDDALAQAEDSWTPRTAEYLIAHPLLADYLSEGLNEHGYSC